MMIDKVIEVLTLAIRIQHETDMCVFIDSMGHVNDLSVSVRKTKKDYDEHVVDLSCTVGSHPNIKYSKKKLDENIRILKNILKKRKIKLEKYKCINDNCSHYSKNDTFAYLDCRRAEDLSDLLGCSKHEYC